MKLSYYLTAALLLVSLAGSGIESKSFIKENKKMQKISEKQKSIDHIVLPVSGQSFDLRLQDISGFKEGLNNNKRHRYTLFKFLYPEEIGDIAARSRAQKFPSRNFRGRSAWERATNC